MARLTHHMVENSLKVVRAGLDQACVANAGAMKPGNGAFAPKDFRRCNGTYSHSLTKMQ
jgi:hypothetical protein